VVVVAAVALFGIAFALTSNTGSDLPAQTRTVKVTGSALPAYTASGADAAVGRKMPELSGQTFEGEALAIAPTGTPKVVMFLAHWCPHCQNEVRALTPYLEENGVPEGVELVSVSTSVDRAKGNYPPST
jgi:cytochrome c biogenesis protein CcmG, thiol:disulfide interchange protein DsbE